MTVIDMHGHIGTWHDFFIPEPSADWLVKADQRIGIAATGVSHLVAIGYDSVTGNRMALAAAEKYPGRLGVWLVANPHRPQDIDLLRDQLQAPNVWGLKIHPDVHEYSVTEPRYAPYFELARQAGAPVLTHGQTRSVWSDPREIARVSARYPELDLLVGHAGVWADGFARTAELVAATPGLHIDICGSRLTSRWIKRFVTIAGAEKVLFGSDASFLDPRIGLGKVNYARISPHDRALVLGGNALRLLGARFRRN